MEKYKEAFRGLDTQTQAMALRFLRSALVPRKTINETVSVYGLKHYLQSATGLYTTLEEFAGALLHAGFRVRIDPYGLCTNYSNRSPVLRKDSGCRCV